MSPTKRLEIKPTFTHIVSTAFAKTDLRPSVELGGGNGGRPPRQFGDTQTIRLRRRDCKWNHPRPQSLQRWSSGTKNERGQAEGRKRGRGVDWTRASNPQARATEVLRGDRGAVNPREVSAQAGIKPSRPFFLPSERSERERTRGARVAGSDTASLNPESPTCSPRSEARRQQTTAAVGMPLRWGGRGHSQTYSYPSGLSALVARRPYRAGTARRHRWGSGRVLG